MPLTRVENVAQKELHPIKISEHRDEVVDS